jgi:hypothetical protein
VTLVEFIAPLAQSTYGNKVLAILYYFARYEDTPAMTVEQIRAGLSRARVRNAKTINVGDVLSKSGANVDTAGTEGAKKLWTLTPTGEKAVRSLLGLPEAELEIEVDVATLTKLIDSISDKNARDFLTEGVTCLQVGALRSSVVFVWSGAVAVLRSAAWKSGPSAVNGALLSHDPKARKVAKLDDFAYVKDVRLLEVLFDLGVIDKTEKTILGHALDLRNSCGHPTKYRPGPKKVSGFVEDVVGIVF